MPIIEVDLDKNRKFTFNSQDSGITAETVQTFFDNQTETEKEALWAKIQGNLENTGSFSMGFSLQSTVKAAPRFPISPDTIFGIYHEEFTKALSNLSNNDLVSLADIIGDTLLSGKQVVLCGVAGAGYVASHFVSDAQMGLRLPLCRISSLSDNTGLIMAWANDVNPVSIFSGQIIRIMEQGDLLIGLSTSGHSSSVIKAMLEARAKGCNVTCITGKTPNNLADAMIDHANNYPGKQHIIEIDSANTPVIQDVYSFIFHAIYVYLLETLKNRFVEGT